jgi:hypothetical protein
MAGAEAAAPSGRANQVSVLAANRRVRVRVNAAVNCAHDVIESLSGCGKFPQRSVFAGSG